MRLTAPTIPGGDSPDYHVDLESDIADYGADDDDLPDFDPFHEKLPSAVTGAIASGEYDDEGMEETLFWSE